MKERKIPNSAQAKSEKNNKEYTKISRGDHTSTFQRIRPQIRPRREKRNK